MSLVMRVGVVDWFTFLRVQISNNGSSEQEVRRHIAMTQNCFQALQNNIWHSSIQVEMKIRLQNVYVLPVLLYGAETWSLTSVLEKKLDAWCGV